SISFLFPLIILVLLLISVLFFSILSSLLLMLFLFVLTSVLRVLISLSLLPTLVSRVFISLSALFNPFFNFDISSLTPMKASSIFLALLEKLLILVSISSVISG